jgi:hypothetical protein
LSITFLLRGLFGNLPFLPNIFNNLKEAQFREGVDIALLGEGLKTRLGGDFCGEKAS